MTSTRSSSSPCRAAVLVAVALGLPLLVGRPVSAASVSANTDAAPPTAPASGGQVLERALTGDVTSGSKNVDMLLEMRRNEAAEVGRSAPARADGPSVQAPAVLPGEAQPASPAVPAPDVGQATLPALVKRGLADTDEALGLPKGSTAQTVRDLGGSGGARGQIGAAAGGVAPATAEPGASGESTPFMRLPALVIRFLRDHRYWLLGAIVLVLALRVAYKKFERRI